MSLFKKKPKLMNLTAQLDAILKHTLAIGENYFYYPINDSELTLANKWCAQNHFTMRADHITDGVIFYKFFKYN